MPALCPECGSFVKKDAESCPRCGADLNAIPLTEPKETQIEELTAGSSGNKNRENYPRLVQEFTAYYNKYQQLRQKVKDHPEILQGYQKDSRYSAYASSNPCMGQFRIILFTLLCKVNFTLNDIVIAWEISPTTSPKEKQCFSAETEALDLIDSLCRELASGNYPEMVMEYKPWDSYGDTPAFTQFVREYGNVDKEYPVASSFSLSRSSSCASSGPTAKSASGQPIS